MENLANSNYQDDDIMPQGALSFQDPLSHFFFNPKGSLAIVNQSGYFYQYEDSVFGRNADGYGIEVPH